MMIFLELTLENFGPYRGKHIINLRPENQAHNSPIILFGGMNGGGKTTLMDAIRLALYGPRAQCSTRGNLSYNEFLIDCINQQSLPHEQTRIELAFEHIINDRWVDLKIVRYWTRNPKDGRDTLGIIEGEWPEPGLANTWDEYVENVLPLGISNLFLFDGEQVKELAEQELPTPPVVEAIKSLLGLELAERLAIDLDILVSRKRKDLATASELANLEEIEAKLTKINQDKEVVLQQLELQQNQLKIAQKKYRQALNKFRIEGGKIAAERQQLENQEKYLGEKVEKIREELRNLAAGFFPLILILPQLKTAKIQGEKELKYQPAKIAKDLLEEKDKRLLDYLYTLSLGQNNLIKIETFLTRENQTLDRELESVSTYLEVNQKSLQHLKNILDYLLPMQQKNVREKLEELTEIERQIEATERQLAIAASPEAYEKLDRDLKTTELEVSNCKTSYEANQQTLKALDRKIQELKKQLEKYSKKTIERQNSEHIIHSVTKVKHTLQLFKEKLTLKKLNKLESEVTECFRYLIHKSNLVHRVVIDTDNFAISLYDPQGKIVPKNRLSAGEKQLLAIALLWGLARVSGKNLPMAIDTPLGRLDSSHRNHLVERYFPTASHQVILLSTDTEIGQKEVTQLRDQKAIAREYLLEYEPAERQTVIKTGYFW
jgi:DNA sulfur modification protein DndD